MTEEDLKLLAGEKFSEFFRCGRNSGLLLRAGNRWRLNGLKIYNNLLSNGEPVFFAADLHHTNPSKLGIERAYIGYDSDLVSRFVCDNVGILGCNLSCTVEAGGGTANNLITLMLETGGAVTKVINWESDARARNLQPFNLHLNGLSPDSITAAATANELEMALTSEKITFAFSNAPFVTAPQIVPIDAEEVHLLPPGVNPYKHEDRLYVDLQQMYATCGWGGPYGLTVTEHFLQTLEPLMASGGHMIIFSDFVSKPDGPTKINELLKRFQHVRPTWRSAGRSFVTVEHQAVQNREALAACYPQLRESRFLNAVEQATITLARQYDFTYVTPRFLILEWP